MDENVFKTHERLVEMADVAEATTSWVKEVLKDVDVEYGQYPETEHAQTTGVRAMVKAAPGEPWIRRYRSGGGIKQFPYEVYLQTRPLTEGERVDGLAILRRLQAAIERGGGPNVGFVLWAHDVTTLPSPISIGENGVITYQLIAVFTYKVD